MYNHSELYLEPQYTYNTLPRANILYIYPSQTPFEGTIRCDEQVHWEGYKVQNNILQSVYLEILIELVYFLDNPTIMNLSKDQFNVDRQHIWDLKLSGIEIG